jgi:RND family efflux transporter MFP subunit
VPVGRATLNIVVKDSGGKPVSGADVRAMARMPGMFMGEKEQQAVPGAPGIYTAPAQFPMAGSYEVAVTVNGEKGVLTLETGRPSGGGGGEFPVVPLLIGVAVLAVAAFILVQMSRTGQRIDTRPLFSRAFLIPMLILGVALAVAVFAVNHWRRPGAMTPIEAQVMDMNVPAPEGTTAVTLATAKMQAFGASVRYSGQVAGYVEQSVYPRVTGVIEWMPLYVGDRVSKGQIIARLDTSQIEPEVAEKSAGVSTAREGVGAAAAEYQMALAGVTEARAEVSTARQMVGEAQAMLNAAREERKSASAEIEAAKAEVDNAKAMLAAAEADQRYMSEELKRMQTLFEQGAVTRDEFQRARADSQKSDAEAAQQREGIRKAQAEVGAAQAGARKADAEVMAANRRVSQAEAQVRSAEAKVRTAQAGADAAKRRISQAQAEVQEKSAGLSGATTMKGYAAIRSEIDGVVVERLISPGVLVNPGQAILRVAQVSPIRLQANVPESDLDRIRVGFGVKVTHRNANEQGVTATVTSVQPGVDPSARTGTVEAVIANRDRAFLPGQFISMEIQLGNRGDRLVIPEVAVQEGDFVWLATPIPGQSGRFTVERRNVRIGEASAGFVAVLDGLSAGDQVVLQGAANLMAGQTVTSLAASTPVAENVTIEVSSAGFTPASVTLSAGKPHRLTFIRKDEQNCGTEVIFPKLGIKKPLPLNQPVLIEIPAQQEGELTFSCGMDMLKGKLVIR